MNGGSYSNCALAVLCGAGLVTQTCVNEIDTLYTYAPKALGLITFAWRSREESAVMVKPMTLRLACLFPGDNCPSVCATAQAISAVTYVQTDLFYRRHGGPHHTITI